MPKKVSPVRQWQPVKVKLSTLDGWDKNPNVMTPEQEKGLAKSIDRHGVAETIVVCQPGKDGKRRIVGGHHRVAELTRRGITEAWAMEPVGKDLTENQRQELGLRLNYDRGAIDFTALVDVPEIVISGAGIDLTEHQGQTSDGKDFTGDEQGKNKCPKCGYEWN